MVRIDTEAHQALVETAARLGLTINRLASMLIKAGCERSDA
jgi:predicted HicB family RNase H-like nuclease